MAEKTISIFISYSHLDSRWFKSDKPLFELIPFLERSLRNVRFWYDRHREQGLEAGDDFLKTIEEEIDKADIAILLISQEFINSRFIAEKELPKIQKRFDEKKLQVFPILLEPCTWDEIEFISKLQMVPGKPTPLMEFTEKEKDWTSTRYEILQSLKKKAEKILEANRPQPVQEPVPVPPEPVPPVPGPGKIPPPPDGSGSGVDGNNVKTKQASSSELSAESCFPITGLKIKDLKGTESILKYKHLKLRSGILISQDNGSTNIPWNKIEEVTFSNQQGTASIKLLGGNMLEKVGFSGFNTLEWIDDNGLSFLTRFSNLSSITIIRDTSVPELTALIRDIPDLVKSTLPESAYTSTLKLEPDDNGFQATLDLSFQGKPAPNGHQVFHMPEKHTFKTNDNRTVSLNIVPTGIINLGAYEPDTAHTLAKALTRLNSLLSEKKIEIKKPVSEQKAENPNPEFDEREWCSGTTIDLRLIGSSSKDNRITIKNKNEVVLNMQVHSSLAYIPVTEGLRIFDISNSASPKMLSLYPAPYLSARWFELLGDIGIMRSGDGAAKVIDLKDPANPKDIFFENYHRNVFNNCGNGLRLYKENIVIDMCHTESCGVKVLDFSDHQEVSKNVREIGKIKFRTGSGTIYDDYLILGDYRDPKIMIVRLKENEVEELKTITLETDAGALIPTGIVAGKGRLYIVGKDMSSYHLRLAIFSLKDFPGEIDLEACYERPKEHSSRNLFGIPLFITDNWLYFSDKRRLVIYDISDPATPILAFEKDGPFKISHISGNMVYCGDDRNIWIFRIEEKK